MSIYSCSAWQHIEKRQRQLEYAGCKTSMSGMSMLYLYKIWIRLFSAYSACGWQLTTMKEHNQHGIWICHKCDDVKWLFRPLTIRQEFRMQYSRISMYSYHVNLFNSIMEIDKMCCDVQRSSATSAPCIKCDAIEKHHRISLYD